MHKLFDARCPPSPNRNGHLFLSSSLSKHAAATQHEAPSRLTPSSSVLQETYKLQWPAPGSPSLCARVQSLLKAAGIPSATNTKRGLDHGVFIPSKLVVPEANIPTVQLSLHASLDKEFHLRLGAALARLRKEGVLIVGSGYATHNLQEFFGAQGVTPAWATTFGQWLEKTMTRLSPEERVRSLLDIESVAPGGSFRTAHPREEHFTPLLVAVGAGAPEAVKAVLDAAPSNTSGAGAAAASVSSTGDSVVEQGAGSGARSAGTQTCRQLFYDMSPGGALMAHYLLT